MLRKLLLFQLILMMFTACRNDKTSVDLIVTNAVIYTADSAFTIHAAMAVADGKILEVGDNGMIQSRYTSDSLLS